MLLLWNICTLGMWLKQSYKRTGTNCCIFDHCGTSVPVLYSSFPTSCIMKAVHPVDSISLDLAPYTTFWVIWIFWVILFGSIPQDIQHHDLFYLSLVLSTKSLFFSKLNICPNTMPLETLEKAEGKKTEKDRNASTVSMICKWWLALTVPRPHIT